MTETLSPGSEDGVARVCHALNDPTCRSILERLEEPTSATDLSGACDCSSSTVYRKLDRLRAAGLVERRHVILPDYSQATRYVRTVDEITIGLDAVRAIESNRPSGGER
ncbi:winged helix-turn-helix domain-containing protein [Halovivax limisalsi]|uniref:winged helix-turn-helix domain-containing protein n=1 Tax=Halovivax limisalsi TaxID=1453760 RepID=UPI001FFCB34D|nr:helix-turn-helix domain-containing protein [Halovivax limisalsi]